MIEDKRILFEIAHPKHIYQFEQIIDVLKRGNEVLIIARDKEVTLKILEEKDIDHFIYGLHGKSIIKKILFIPKILIDYIRILKKFEPDIIISKSSPYATVLKHIIPIKTVIMPDAEVVPIINNFVAPKSDLVITPKNFNISYGDHHKRISSFFEYGYLAPQYFKPEPLVLQELGLRQKEKFYICRFISWNANHDLNQFGFTTEQKKEIVDILSNFGKVYISSESELDEELRLNRMNIKPSLMHSALFYSSLYIGDSQTMATEAALLGTPSIRYSSFVGENDMSNFLELEKMGFLFNHRDFGKLKARLIELLESPGLKKTWGQKRKILFSSDIDINSEIIKYISQMKFGY